MVSSQVFVSCFLDKRQCLNFYLLGLCLASTAILDTIRIIQDNLQIVSEDVWKISDDDDGIEVMAIATNYKYKEIFKEQFLFLNVVLANIISVFEYPSYKKNMLLNSLKPNLIT